MHVCMCVRVCGWVCVCTCVIHCCTGHRGSAGVKNSRLLSLMAAGKHLSALSRVLAGRGAGLIHSRKMLNMMDSAGAAQALRGQASL